jgi:hypothetical protein
VVRRVDMKLGKPRRGEVLSSRRGEVIRGG